MIRRQWIIAISINLLTILLVLSPFLPGPSFLSKPTNIIFSLAQLGSLLGVLLVPIGLTWTFSRIKQGKNIKILSVLLWTVPVVSFIFSIGGSVLARDISRKIAINNASSLITAIEDYKDMHEEYPANISELKPTFIKEIPKPGVMGIGRYGYKKKNESYNLMFSQNVTIGLNSEIVVYDPEQNHKAEGELETLYDTGEKNWKYYIYD